MMITVRTQWTIISALFGFTAIVLGAAGGHLVSDPLTQANIEKASSYQLLHVLLMLYLNENNGRYASKALWMLCIGIVLFCGSLYVKAFLGLEHAPLAPYGGMCLMGGWLLIAMNAAKKSSPPGESSSNEP